MVCQNNVGTTFAVAGVILDHDDEDVKIRWGGWLTVEYAAAAATANT